MAADQHPDKDKVTGMLSTWMEGMMSLINRLVEDTARVHALTKDQATLQIKMDYLSTQFTEVIQELREIRVAIQNYVQWNDFKGEKDAILQALKDTEHRLEERIKVLESDQKVLQASEHQFREKMWLHVGKYAVITTLVLTAVAQVVVWAVKALIPPGH